MTENKSYDLRFCIVDILTTSLAYSIFVAFSPFRHLKYRQTQLEQEIL